jgi:DNA (cytosine-5)-methyltransferase 1
MATTKSLPSASRDSTLSNHSVSCEGPERRHESGRVAAPNDLLIDLDELDEETNIWDDEELQYLRVEDISLEDGTGQNEKASAKVGLPQRNLPIAEPLIRLASFQHMKFLLRPKKTVELSDGDFLHITDIIRDSTTEEVTLRGIRYQRCNALNGMLERKLNEVCLFYEIDLDDPRKPHEQSAIEVPVDKVKVLRSIRRTNLSFPLARNFAADQFHSSEEIAAQGGLTARWKYTCKYHSADDRWSNRWTERSLENFSEEECTNGYGLSNVERRFQWRGETTMGGSHVPSSIDRNLSCPNREERPISIGSEDSEPNLLQISGHSNTPQLSEGRQSRDRQSLPITSSRKRERSPELIVLESHDEAKHVLKKLSLMNRGDKKAGKQRTASLQVLEASSRRLQHVIDLESEPSHHNLASSNSKSQNPTPPLFNSANTPKSILLASRKANINSSIGMWSSELAEPPPAGAIHYCNQQSYGPSIRFPGQMLTFGDAFCGAGGTTRGAVMAGLKVKWGFDFWENACTTWKANFSDAVCYCMPSEEFVGMAQNSNRGSLAEVKVDILHLSPPCQYFSPAHTVNGIDDEMNTASLYAVLEVVKAVKPRVVTLEQTFGILGARCRWYFSSVIHMFALLRFSVRWAIVPLATWVCLEK